MNLSTSETFHDNFTLTTVAMDNTTCVSNTSCVTESFNDFGAWLFDDASSVTNNSLYMAYKLWFFIIDVILILPTILGNSLILISLIRYKSLRKTKAFILIGNLAVSDLLVGLVVIPMDIYLLLTDYLSNNRTYCLYYYCLIYTLITASVLNLFLLSVERFHAIIRPFQHNLRFTARRVYLIICITWLLVILFGSLPLLGWKTDVSDEKIICRSTVLFTKAYRIIANAIIVTALTISFAFFIVVIKIALNKTKETELKLADLTDLGSNEINGRTTLRRDIRHTRLMVLVSGLFIICWGPYCIISLVPNVSDVVSFVRNWLSSLGLINSCLNWVVYGARNKRFRAAFKSILTCSCRRRGEVKINTNST